jgi:hypothetical protein
MLGASRFGWAARADGPTIFDRLLTERRPPGADAPLLEAMAARIPCFAVRLGSSCFAGPRAAHVLLEAVLARSAAA